MWDLCHFGRRMRLVRVFCVGLASFWAEIAPSPRGWEGVREVRGAEVSVMGGRGVLPVTVTIGVEGKFDDIARRMR